MILTDDDYAAEQLRMMTYDGRKSMFLGVNKILA